MIGDRERLVPLEDLPMQMLQLGGGVGPELVGEDLASTLVRGERLGLSPGAIQREHEARPHPFAERIPRGQGLEFRNDGGRTSQSELGRDPVLRRREARFVESGDLATE